jgi:Ca2+-binding RTX toxin-like protein
MLLLRKRLRGHSLRLKERRKGMRRAILLLAVTAATLLVASGVAFAVTKLGGPGDNTIYGINNPDKIDGRSGDDTIYGLGGDDRCTLDGYLIGGQGNDTIYGGAGDDIFGGGNSVVECGGEQQPDERGRDVLYGRKGQRLREGRRGGRPYPWQPRP